MLATRISRKMISWDLYMSCTLFKAVHHVFEHHFGPDVVYIGSHRRNLAVKHVDQSHQCGDISCFSQRGHQHRYDVMSLKMRDTHSAVEGFLE